MARIDNLPAYKKGRINFDNQHKITKMKIELLMIEPATLTFSGLIAIFVSLVAAVVEHRILNGGGTKVGKGNGGNSTY